MQRCYLLDMRTAFFLSLLLPGALQVTLAPVVLHGALDGRPQLNACPSECQQTPISGSAASKRLTDAPRISAQPGASKPLDCALADSSPQVCDHRFSSLGIDADARADGVSVHSRPKKPRAPPFKPLF